MSSADHVVGEFDNTNEIPQDDMIHKKFGESLRRKKDVGAYVCVLLYHTEIEEEDAIHRMFDLGANRVQYSRYSTTSGFLTASLYNSSGLVETVSTADMKEETRESAPFGVVPSDKKRNVGDYMSEEHGFEVTMGPHLRTESKPDRQP